MIIVSQDKTNILNFSNLQNVRIEPYGTHEKGKKIYKIFYKKKRAKLYI